MADTGVRGARLTAAGVLVALSTAGCAPVKDGDNERPTGNRSASSALPAVAERLLAAAARGDARSVAELLEQGGAWDVPDARGRTPLVAASYGNHVAAAQALIRAGADVNHKDDSQQSAYLIATSEVGDDPRLLELTLAAGAHVNDKDSYNGTGLIRAAERGHPLIVARLLRAGIDKNHVNRLGWTALLEAIILGDGGPAHVETIRLLLEAGADPHVPDGEGRSALTHARERGQRSVIALLLAADARTKASVRPK